MNFVTNINFEDTMILMEENKSISDIISQRNNKTINRFGLSMDAMDALRNKGFFEYPARAISADWWVLYQQNPDFVNSMLGVSICDDNDDDDDGTDIEGIIAFNENNNNDQYPVKKSTKRYDIRDKAKHGSYKYSWCNNHLSKHVSHKKMRKCFDTSMKGNMAKDVFNTDYIW